MGDVGTPEKSMLVGATCPARGRLTAKGRLASVVNGVPLTVALAFRVTPETGSLPFSRTPIWSKTANPWMVLALTGLVGGVVNSSTAGLGGSIIKVTSVPLSVTIALP